MIFYDHVNAKYVHSFKCHVGMMQLPLILSGHPVHVKLRKDCFQTGPLIADLK